MITWRPRGADITVSAQNESSEKKSWGRKTERWDKNNWEWETETEIRRETGLWSNGVKEVKSSEGHMTHSAQSSELLRVSAGTMPLSKMLSMRFKTDQFTSPDQWLNSLLGFNYNDYWSAPFLTSRMYCWQTVINPGWQPYGCRGGLTSSHFTSYNLDAKLFLLFIVSAQTEILSAMK